MSSDFCWGSRAPFRFATGSVSRALSSLVVLLVAACASGPRPFPLKDPVWRDDGDFREFAAAPEEYEPATFWEVFDNTLLRPVPRLFAFESTRRAVNVNSWDEVPDSSWFTNRMREKPPTPAEAARGACDHEIDPAGPFEVIGGKPDGLNPGFLIQTKAGKKYFFKFDGDDQPERATAADVIGSKLYHAVGYHAPCNQILYFDPKALVLSPKATIKRDGKKVPMTQADVDKAFGVVKREPDGKVRGFASEFLAGKPLGPWTYEGTRSDDPNDVIPHEDRRDVRGGYVMAAWTNHFDSRDQNTLTMWRDDDKDGKGYVRHHIIDFGDCFGSIWIYDEMSRRHGQTYYLKVGHVLADFATLGLIERPWDRAKLGPAGWALGYYDADNFVPDEWHNGYPLPGFSKMREEDGAWMARFIAELSDAHLNAIIDQAKLKNQVLDRELRKAIIGRKNKVLARWLGRLSPLSHPTIDAKGELCVHDLAVHAGVAPAGGRTYVASYDGNSLLVTPRTPERICVSLPHDTKSDKDHPTPALVEITTNRAPLRLHLYSLGNHQWKIVGIERPEPESPSSEGGFTPHTRELRDH